MFLSSKIIALIILISLAGGGILSYLKKPSTPIQKACSMEAKVCPDGSAVSRSGPDCTFAACPQQNTTITKNGVEGTVLLGPTCPVMKNPPDPKCADRPYQTMLEVAYPDSPTSIAQFKSDVNGMFRVDLPVGSYVIHGAAGAARLPRCASTTITVTKNNYTSTTIFCDTGIR